MAEPELSQPSVDDTSNNTNKRRKQQYYKNKKKRGKERSSNKMRGKGVEEEEEEEEEGSCCHRLMDYSELPEYMKDNGYILRYYRADWPLTRAFLSLFSFHNETLNVWTHLLGFLLFLGLTLHHLDGLPQLADIMSHLPWSISPRADTNISSNQGNFSNGAAASLIKLATASPSEIRHNLSPAAARWPFFVFLGGSMFCLLTSSICHLFCCHSHRLNIFLSRLDYVGISVMIVTSFFPPIYYIFQCDPRWQFSYLSAITVMGVFTVINLLSPHLSSGACRSYRAMLFVAMGLFGVVPAVHATVVNWSEPRRPLTLAYEMAMAMSYLTGTFFYVTRIPERWKPGWFDLAGHSHQIFHVFVMAGALAHYEAALIFLEWRDSVGC